MATTREQSELRRIASLIDKAVDEHVANVRDAEGQTPLETLISELQDSSTDVSQWRSGLIEEVGQRKSTKMSANWWHAIELFTAMTGLHSRPLADLLESILVGPHCPAALGRASIYEMLSECNRPITAASILQDKDLYESSPVIWLDLALPLIPDSVSRQKIVLNLIRRRKLNVNDLERRLDEIRSVGGRHLGAWLENLTTALPQSEREKFEGLVAEHFTTSSTPEIQSSRSILSFRRMASPNSRHATKQLMNVAATKSLVAKINRVKQAAQEAREEVHA